MATEARNGMDHHKRRAPLNYETAQIFLLGEIYDKRRGEPGPAFTQQIFRFKDVSQCSKDTQNRRIFTLEKKKKIIIYTHSTYPENKTVFWTAEDESWRHQSYHQTDLTVETYVLTKRGLIL